MYLEKFIYSSFFFFFGFNICFIGNHWSILQQRYDQLFCLQKRLSHMGSRRISKSCNTS